MTKLAYSIDGEMFDIDSMQELIEQYQTETPETSIVGEVYWVGEAVPLSPEKIYDFDDMVDSIYDRLPDVVGECVDSLDISGKEEYNTFIKDFLERNSNLSSFYNLLKVEEKTITEEDLK